MKNYITRDDTVFALSRMKRFHNDLRDVMSRNGFDLLSNLGRRNILLSQAQEKYFAEALSRRHDVVCDGRTGEPDIVMNCIDRELECKLTSRQKSGAISFQTDYETLVKKKRLDYLYVVADEAFDKFAVIHYKDLTPSDFRDLSSGSRGKSQLMKHSAADRADVLFGNIENINTRELKKLENKLNKKNLTNIQKNRLKKSVSYWKNIPTKYSISLEAIDDNKCR
jgi:nitrogen regulatory protein PII-like uncharacterized protein